MGLQRRSGPATTRYAMALGSNRRSRHGAPAATLDAAIGSVGEIGCVSALSALRNTPALGPAGRSFANAALILNTALDPAELLGALKEVERDFGRRGGRRWGPRVLDLDILLWSGGAYAEAKLTIPHPGLKERAFVLEPLAEIAPDWRDPLSHLTVAQLLQRLRARRPVDRAGARS